MRPSSPPLPIPQKNANRSSGLSEPKYDESGWDFSAANGAKFLAKTPPSSFTASQGSADLVPSTLSTTPQRLARNEAQSHISSPIGTSLLAAKQRRQVGALNLSPGWGKSMVGEHSHSQHQEDHQQHYQQPRLAKTPERHQMGDQFGQSEASLRQSSPIGASLLRRKKINSLSGLQKESARMKTGQLQMPAFGGLGSYSANDSNLLSTGVSVNPDASQNTGTNILQTPSSPMGKFYEVLVMSLHMFCHLDYKHLVLL